ncbi:PIN domain-containing protein, partial [bacterium]
MNTQRFIWAATTLLFGIAGAMLGFFLGQRYALWLNTESSTAPGSAFIAPTLSICFLIVMARGGSALADKTLIPGIRRLADLPAADRMLGVSGALFGLIVGAILAFTLIPTGPTNALALLPIKFCVMAISTSLGMAFFGGMRAEMLRLFPQLEPDAPALANGTVPKFLDTNIIIDGRLADICKTGFIEGPIYVPQFVLEEVQYVADSSDSMRRARGRRGLDVLNAMREMTTPQIVGGTTVLVPVVHVLNDISLAVQKISAVDSKLVALAKEKNGSIITNDFNLNKVAELQGVQVLNLNELAQALKPVV